MPQAKEQGKAIIQAKSKLTLSGISGYWEYVLLKNADVGRDFQKLFPVVIPDLLRKE